MADLRLPLLWLNSVLIAFTLCAVVSRAGRKIFIVRKFGWHDGFIVVAATSATIFSVLQMASTWWGFGQEGVNVSPSNLPELRKLLITSDVFYFLCNWAIKHALLFFYSEITRERTHRICINIMHGVAFGFGSSSILADLFRCRPFNKTFYPEIVGYCIDIDKFYYYNSSMMLATDVVLYAMPVVFTRNLMLRRAQKIGLNCLFGLGGLVLAASGARVWAVHIFATKPDFTSRFAVVMIFSVIENHTAILVACAPSIKIFALIVFPKLTSSLGKLASLVTTTASGTSQTARSKSHTTNTLGLVDLESVQSPGQSQAGEHSLVSRGENMEDLRVASREPGPAHKRHGDREATKTVRGFPGWFERSERDQTADNTDEMGLVYVEHSFSVERSVRTPDA